MKRRPAPQARGGSYTEHTSWRTRIRHSQRFIPLAILWIIPILIVALATPLTFGLDRSSVGVSEEVTIRVGSREVDQATAVMIKGKLSPEPVIRAEIAGVVTALSEATNVEQGSQLLAIDGVPVLAYKGPVLYRDVGEGDEGADVEGIGSFLKTLGILSADAQIARVDQEMASAFRQFQTELGVAADSTFRRQYVAYIPDGVDKLTRAHVQLGAQVNEGDQVFSGEAIVTSLEVDPLAGGTLNDLSDQELVLRVDQTQVPIPGILITGDDAAQVADELASLVDAGSLSMTGAGDGDAQYEGAVLALKTPQRHGVVPSSAVLVDDDGLMCIFVIDDKPDAGSSSPNAIPVPDAKAGTELGTVLVDARLAGESVLRAPDSAATPGASCT